MLFKEKSLKVRVEEWRKGVRCFVMCMSLDFKWNVTCNVKMLHSWPQMCEINKSMNFFSSSWWRICSFRSHAQTLSFHQPLSPYRPLKCSLKYLRFQLHCQLSTWCLLMKIMCYDQKLYNSFVIDLEVRLSTDVPEVRNEPEGFCCGQISQVCLSSDFLRIIHSNLLQHDNLVRW